MAAIGPVCPGRGGRRPPRSADRRSIANRRRGATAVCSWARRIRARRQDVPRGLRARPRRARRARSAARGPLATGRNSPDGYRGARHPQRRASGRAAAAQDGDRRRPGARVYLSYPRLDVSETRARCRRSTRSTSFVPSPAGSPIIGVLASGCSRGGRRQPGLAGAGDADRAIDDLEHDLAVLKPLLDAADRASVEATAHYMLGLNEALRRSVISRWSRDRREWSTSDGGFESPRARRPRSTPTGCTSARTRCRRCSASRAVPISSCWRRSTELEPWDEPRTPLMRMDPPDARQPVSQDPGGLLPRDGGAPRACRLPRTGFTMPRDAGRSAARRVGAECAEMLAPAIERVWQDEIEEIRRDLGIWLQRIAAETDAGAWQPEMLLEFSFGLSDEGPGSSAVCRIRSSSTDDSSCAVRSVDLIEHPRGPCALPRDRPQTGRNRSNKDLIVGGGGTLQPVLYAWRSRQGLGQAGRRRPLVLRHDRRRMRANTASTSPITRRQGIEVLQIIDRAVEGRLPRAGAGRPAPGATSVQCAVRAKSSATPHQDRRSPGRPAGRCGACDDRQSPRLSRRGSAPDDDARRAIRDDLDATLVVRPRPEPARRRSWSTGFCACWRRGAPTMEHDRRRSPSPRRLPAS